MPDSYEFKLDIAVEDSLLTMNQKRLNLGYSSLIYAPKGSPEMSGQTPEKTWCPGAYLVGGDRPLRLLD